MGFKMPLIFKPLILNPKIGPWKKFHDKWNPIGIHKLSNRIKRIPRINPKMNKFEILTNEIPAFNKWMRTKRTDETANAKYLLIDTYKFPRISPLKTVSSIIAPIVNKNMYPVNRIIENENFSKRMSPFK